MTFSKSVSKRPNLCQNDSSIFGQKHVSVSKWHCVEIVCVEVTGTRLVSAEASIAFVGSHYTSFVCCGHHIVINQIQIILSTFCTPGEDLNKTSQRSRADIGTQQILGREGSHQKVSGNGVSAALY